MRTEDTGLGGNTQRTFKNFGEFIHERCGNFGRAAVGEGWPASLAGVSVKGELGNNDGRPTRIQDGSVKLALGIFENAQVAIFSARKRACSSVSP